MSESSFFKGRYGKATDNRDTRQKIVDENFVPIGVDPEHRFDSRIARLEAEQKQAERDQEFRELKTAEERELFTLKERRKADFEKADTALERAKRLQPVATEMKALQDLRAKLEQDPITTVSRLVEIDKALAQYKAVGDGVDRRHADKLYQQIRDNEARIIAERRQSLTDQKIALEKQLSALEIVSQNPSAEPEPAPKVEVPQAATLSERSDLLWNTFKERADTVALVELAELQQSGDAEALRTFVEQHTVAAEPQSNVVIAGDE